MLNEKQRALLKMQSDHEQLWARVRLMRDGLEEVEKFATKTDPVLANALPKHIRAQVAASLIVLAELRKQDLELELLEMGE